MPINYITYRVPLPVIEPDIKDVGFTLSYNLKTQSFISEHSYLPEMYLNSGDRLMTIDSGKIWTHDGDTYQNIYGVVRDWIVEYPSNTESLKGQLLEYLEFVCDIKLDGKITDKIFDKIIIWNDDHCTGLLSIEIPRNTQGQHFLLQKINNQNSPFTIVADRNEGMWNINRLRDYWDGSTAMFNEDILSQDIQDVYPMDKLFNPLSVLDQQAISHQWRKVSLLYGKTYNIRVIFSNFVGGDDESFYKIEMLVNFVKTKKDKNG